MSCKGKIVEKKDPMVQLEVSKFSIKNLFSDLLNETKGFTYKITVKFLLRKYQHNEEIEFRPVYFNSVTKAVTNHIFKLENYFEEILYMIDVWIDNKHPERIKKTYKKIAEKLDYDRTEFPVQAKDFNKIEVKNNICINVFGFQNRLIFPIYVSD